MSRYMLDTNTASYLIKGHSVVKERIIQTPMAEIFISAITEAELLRGAAKKASNHPLHLIIREFLLRVESLPWNSKAAKSYRDLRHYCDQQGKQLGGMDMLIAAHALAEAAILVTNDQAFYHLQPYLQLQDWTK